MTREFDLNIERVLENWTVAHALREVIANALQPLRATRRRSAARSEALSPPQWAVRA